jgi:NAD(P)-dependent dehydrogenase (short-subunit alcohol dehydrogenase family)
VAVVNTHDTHPGATSTSIAVNTLLADKVILVTGGSSGIGRATAMALARAGACVVIADVDTAGGQTTVVAIDREGGDACSTSGALVPRARVDALSLVAATVVWLVSDAATFIHGHALPIDGGLLTQGAW